MDTTIKEENVIYPYRDMSLSLCFYLFYEAATQLGFRLVKAEKDKSLTFLFDDGILSGKELLLDFDTEKVNFTVPVHESPMYLKNYSEMIINKFHSLAATMDTAQREAGMEKMNRELFLSGDTYNLVHEEEEEKGSWFQRVLLAFVPGKGYFVTPVIIGINVLLFLLMILSGAHLFSPGNEMLLKWGGNFRPFTLDNQWWRLLSSNYLHIGIIHLAFNMYALAYIGRIIEPITGRLRFLAVYTITGIFGSIASLCWHDNVISAGASGAIFGLYGFYAALLASNYLGKEYRKEQMANVLGVIGINLVIGMQAGFDNAGHLGGAVSGFLLGFLCIQELKKKNEKSGPYLLTSIATVLTLAAVVLVCKALPNDVVEYDERMEEFSAMEKTALQLHQLPENTSSAEFMKVISTTTLPNWKKCAALIEELDKLDLPEKVHQRNTKLKKYCSLRIRVYEQYYLGMKEDSDAYNASIDSCNIALEELLKELNGE